MSAIVRYATVLLAALLVGGCTIRYDSSRFQAVEMELAAIVQELVEAIERADVAGAFKYHSTAPEAVFIVDGRAYSRTELVETYTQAYAAVDRQEIEYSSPQTQFISVDEAIMTLTGTVKTVMKNGSSTSSGIAWTLVWTRTEAGWRLSHVHQSFPGRSGRS